MEDAIALIDKIIEEHKTIFQRLRNFEQIANDAEALTGFDKAKELFVPGRLESKKGLVAFAEVLGTITEGMHSHFGREEGALMKVFREHGDKKLSSALHSLLLEHEDLKHRLASTKQDVATLQDGKLPNQIWQAHAHDMRAYITYTRKLFEAHAGLEQELFRSLRSDLMKAAERNK
ncbi:MAG: hemerythrin domain-containing protein [Chloroflexi bacterium]|nr:hemerythrin domain-containing protein [Chloroflexota bacterium]